MELLIRTRRPESRVSMVEAVDGVEMVVILSRRRFIRVRTVVVNVDVESESRTGASLRINARVEDRH